MMKVFYTKTHYEDFGRTSITDRFLADNTKEEAQYILCMVYDESTVFWSCVPNEKDIEFLKNQLDPETFSRVVAAAPKEDMINPFHTLKVLILLSEKTENRNAMIHIEWCIHKRVNDNRNYGLCPPYIPYNTRVIGFIDNGVYHFDEALTEKQKIEIMKNIYYNMVNRTYEATTF
ncbi:MAG: hypothetical protein N3A54_04065 [Patescibacteria group bacterium]|nr:hypothetical protein [Patescibacteria group bacterium]